MGIFLLSMASYLSWQFLGYFALGGAGILAIAAIPRRVYSAVGNFLFGSENPEPAVAVDPEVFPDFPLLALDDDARERYSSLSSKEQSKFSLARSYLIRMSELGLPTSKVSAKKAYARQTFLSRRKVHSHLCYAGNWATYKTKIDGRMADDLDDLKAQYLRQGDFPLYSLKELVKIASCYNDIALFTDKLQDDIDAFSNPFASNRLSRADKKALAENIKNLNAHISLKQFQLVESMLERLALFQVAPELKGDVLVSTFRQVKDLILDKAWLPQELVQKDFQENGLLDMFPQKHINQFAKIIARSGTPSQRERLKVLLSEAIGVDKITLYRDGTVDGALFGLSNKALRQVILYAGRTSQLPTLFSLEKHFLKQRFEETVQKISTLEDTAGTWLIHQLQGESSHLALDNYQHYLKSINKQIEALETLEKRRKLSSFFPRLFWGRIKGAVALSVKALVMERAKVQHELINYLGVVEANLNSSEFDVSARCGLSRHINVMQQLKLSLIDAEAKERVDGFVAVAQAKLNVASGMQSESEGETKHIVHKVKLEGVRRALNLSGTGSDSKINRIEQLALGFSKGALAGDDFAYFYFYFKDKAKTEQANMPVVIKVIQARCLENIRSQLANALADCVLDVKAKAITNSNCLMQSMKFLKLFPHGSSKKLSLKLAKLALTQLPECYKSSSSRNYKIRLLENLVTFAGGKRLRSGLHIVREKGYKNWKEQEMPQKFIKQVMSKKKILQVKDGFRIRLAANEYSLFEYLEKHSSVSSVYLDVKALLVEVRSTRQSLSSLTLTYEDRKLLGVEGREHMDVAAVLELLSLQDTLLNRVVQSKHDVQAMVNEYNEKIDVLANDSSTTVTAVLRSCWLGAAPSGKNFPLNTFSYTQGGSCYGS